jgi:hypothetical protein
MGSRSQTTRAALHGPPFSRVSLALASGTPAHLLSGWIKTARSPMNRHAQAARCGAWAAQLRGAGRAHGGPQGLGADRAVRLVDGRRCGLCGEDGLVDGEDDRLVIVPAGCPQRWALGRPDDPYGDGYVHRVFAEVSDDGIAASG